MKKGGEITTKMLVGIIILVISFAVILFLIMRLDLGNTSVKEICHNSVVMKSRNPAGFASGALDCSTSYVCISGGRDCENFAYDEKVEIDLNQPPLKIKNATLAAIADEMVDCWWMFGGGEVDAVGEPGGMKCGVCSTIRFEPSLSALSITYQDLYDYLMNTKQGEETHLSYLYNVLSLGASSLTRFQSEVRGFSMSTPISVSEKYVVMLGWDPEGTVVTPSRDKFLSPYLLKSSEVSTALASSCNSFDLIKP